MDYARLRDKTVAPLIAKWGTPITYRSFTESPDPASGLNARTPTDTPASAIMDSFSFNQVDGTLVKQGDGKLLLSGTIPEPVPGDQVLIGAAWWTVIALVSTAAPAAVAISYVVQVRK
jgi:hypothetical protein